MTRIIAHRGYTKEHPENTLAAFAAALALGSDGVELDVHATSDGEIIIHHDYYLGHPDNGAGLIFQQSSDYVKNLKIGEKEKISTLKEVFELAGKRLNYEIELKGFTGEFLEKIVDLVRRFELIDNVEFTSPSVYSLTKIKELLPDAKTGYFVSFFPEWMDDELGRALLINNALLGGITVLHCPWEMINARLIEEAHQNKLLIHAANCDTKQALQKAFSFKVDQLSTNVLELALAQRTNSEKIT